MKLIKLTDDRYVVVNETIQPVNGYYYDAFINKIKSTNGAEYGEASHCWQITHSTQPLEPVVIDISPVGTPIIDYEYDKVKQLSLQEVKELIGEVDVEKKAKNVVNKEVSSDAIDYNFSSIYQAFWVDGYNQALEDNKEKKYTEEDMKTAFSRYAFVSTNNQPYNEDELLTEFYEFIQSLQPKTSWEVEWETIDNRQPCNCSCHNNPNMIHFVACCNNGWIGKVTQKLKLK